MPTLRSLIACLLILSAHTASAQSPRAYDADDLGTLGGTYLLASAMNNNGDIVGSGTTADGTLHAFRWTRSGGLEDLGTFGGLEAQATGINDSGDILGFYFDEEFVPHAFLLPAGGTMQPIADVFQPSGLGANDWFTGMSANARPFRATPGTAIQDLGAFIGFGTAVNGNGDTTGYSWHEDPPSPTSQPTAFRYSDAAGFVDLGTFGGTWSYAYAINATGTVVGGASTAAGVQRAFRAVPGSPLQDLGTPLADPESGAVAYGLNDAGDVVGQAYSIAGSLVPFRYSDDKGIVDLSPLIPIAARGRPYSAIAINTRKEILAVYTDPNGEFRTQLLRPRTAVNPPVVSALSADPNVLTPPNGRMVPVAIGVSVTDEYDVNPACRITGVFDSAAPFAQPNRDVQITGALTVNLRARRDGGDDRTYAIFVTCTNYFAKSATRFTLVRVPGR
jgi:probable HAF family extracellular repeat protein